MKQINTTSYATDLSEFHKISDVKVPVPLRMPGNVIEHIPIVFEVWGKETRFKAIPFCSKANRVLTNLPDSIDFQVIEDEVTTLKTQYRDIARDIMKVLMVQ